MKTRVRKLKTADRRRPVHGFSQEPEPRIQRETILIATIWLALLGSSGWAQNAAIDWYRVANGGGCISGNGCTIMGTVGQAETGLMRSGNVAIQGGFWSFAAIAPAPISVITWTNQAGGNWSSPINWDPNQVPGPADNAHIDTLRNMSQTVTVDGDFIIGSLTLSGGRLAGSGKLLINGPLNWTGGMITNIVQCNGGTIGGSKANLALVGGRLVNSGILTLATLANYHFYAGDGSVISNLLGATIDVVTDNGSDPSGMLQSTIYNAGLFRKSAGTGAAAIGAAFINLSTGRVEADSGILSLTYPGTYEGACAANGTAILDFPSGTHDLSAGCRLEGDGTVRCSGADLNATSLITASSALRFSLTGGTLGGPARLALAGPLTWDGGSITGIVQCNGGSITAVATYKTLVGGQLINTGVLTVNTPAGLPLMTGRGSLINNQAGAILDFAGNSGTDYYGAPAGTIYNEGLIRKSAGAGTAAIADVINNSGTVEGRSGRLDFTQGYLQSAGKTRLWEGQLQVEQGFTLQGGVLEGTNVLIGNVTNSATVSPGGSPGLLTITGNYWQTAAGVLQIELGGPAPEIGVDRLTVSGTASLAGALSVSLINGFTPPANSTFGFLTAASRTGSFQAINLPSGQSSLSVAYSGSGASLTTTAAPQPPVISVVTVSADKAINLAWPASATDYTLEVASKLNGGSSSPWAPIEPTLLRTNSGTVSYSEKPTPAGDKFFRLRKQ